MIKAGCNSFYLPIPIQYCRLAVIEIKLYVEYFTTDRFIR